MKRVNDYTREELVELSEEEVKTLIDIEFAYEGVIVEKIPVEPKYEEITIDKTDVAYGVGSAYYKNEEDAKIVSELATSRSTYDYYTSGCDYQYLEANNDITVRKELFYKKEEIELLTPLIKKNKALREKFEKDENIYTDYLSKTTHLSSRVTNAVSAAWAWKNKKENAQTQYDRYLELANNDEEIAKNFFRTAFSNDEELLKEIINEEIPQDSTEEEVEKK